MRQNKKHWTKECSGKKHIFHCYIECFIKYVDSWTPLLNSAVINLSFWVHWERLKTCLLFIFISVNILLTIIIPFHIINFLDKFTFNSYFVKKLKVNLKNWEKVIIKITEKHSNIQDEYQISSHYFTLNLYEIEKYLSKDFTVIN